MKELLNKKKHHYNKYSISYKDILSDLSSAVCSVKYNNIKKFSLLKTAEDYCKLITLSNLFFSAEDCSIIAVIKSTITAEVLIMSDTIIYKYNIRKISTED